jgi:hypothetical protein
MDQIIDLRTLLSIISTTAIVAGGIFAAVQLRLINKQRARESALQLVHSARTPEFLNAVNIVFDLPDGLSKKDIEERLGDKMTNILVMFGTFESLGILIFRKEIDIKLVDDFFSGIIVLAGRKFKNYLVEVRNASHRQTYYEWFQWLYDQFEKRELKTPAVPSYITFRDWKE